ncbi:MAG: cupin domain-containing protein, partial [Actinocrinis sp.]
MPVIRPAEAVVHEMHGARFTSYAAPSTGSGELCVWRIELPAPAEPAHGDAPRAVPHRISREEVFVVVGGNLRLTLDGRSEPLSAGDVAIAPAGSLLALENLGPGSAAAWVSTSV